MGLPSIQSASDSYCLSPKIYQPADMEGGPSEFQRKKKTFSSSSFYEEPRRLYPTVEEQVQLCRSIAESLSDDCNHSSRGASMFFKRVKKAEKWIVAHTPEEEEGEERAEGAEALSQLPYVRPRKQPKLKLLLDPRHIIDMQRLLAEGVDIVQHDAVSPEVCHKLVRDLNGPSGKGALLFARRKKKSEEWVVDEHKVRDLLGDRYPSRPPVDAVVESVLRAAEAKVMRYPNAVPQVPVISHLETPPEPTKLASSPVFPSMSFTNFNSSPKAWNSASAPPPTVRPVRPPSLLMA